ncbi:MAG: hypothetical protein ABIH22_02405 [Candidatus Margulisiibacteriota bacterium]
MATQANITQRVSPAQSKSVEPRKDSSGGGSLFITNRPHMTKLAGMIPLKKDSRFQDGTRTPATPTSLALLAGDAPVRGAFEEPKIEELTFNKNNVEGEKYQGSVSQVSSSLLALKVLFGALNPEANEPIGEAAALVRNGVLINV